MSRLIVKIPEIYDGFRSDFNIPVQITAALSNSIKPKVSVFIEKEESMTEFANIGRSELCIKLPISPGGKSGKVDVIFELEDDNGKERYEYTVDVTDPEYMPLDKENTPDMIFARMMLKDVVAMEDAMNDPAIRRLVPYSGVFNPDTEYATNIAKGILKYLSKFNLGRLTVKNGLIRAPSLVDVVDNLETDTETDALSLGLLFCHIAYRLNLKPILILTDTTCIAGIAVNEFSLTMSKFDSDVKFLVINGNTVQSINSSASFILMDMSMTASLEDSIESARSVIGREQIKDTRVCYVPYELDVNEYCGRKYGISGE